MWREWQAFLRMEISAEQRADFHTKYLAMHIAGDPERTTADHRFPWEPNPDED